MSVTDQGPSESPRYALDETVAIGSFGIAIIGAMLFIITLGPSCVPGISRMGNIHGLSMLIGSLGLTCTLPFFVLGVVLGIMGRAHPNPRYRLATIGLIANLLYLLFPVAGLILASVLASR